jgi:hypothetical protein
MYKKQKPAGQSGEYRPDSRISYPQENQMAIERRMRIRSTAKGELKR